MSFPTEIPHYAQEVAYLRNMISRYGEGYIASPYTVVPLGERLDRALANLSRVANAERSQVSEQHRKRWH